MNIMEIEIDATTKEDYVEIHDLMIANVPCIAFIKVKFHSDEFKDGFVTQHFVGVAHDKEYFTISSGPHFYEMGLKGMYADGKPVLEVEYEN